MRALRRLDGTWAVARLAPDTGWPSWATWSTQLSAMVRTPEECSIVCEEHLVPPAVRAERGWAAFAVAGPIPFDETGVLAGLTAPLAAARIGVFALSTFDTDYLLVPSAALDDAMRAWRAAGIAVTA